ncbi:MAG: phosphotransferase [Polyangiales bacterium]
MRDPAPATAELLARAHAAVPGLEGARHLATSVKCTLFSASRGGAPVVVKVLRRDVPPWRWYFARELALLDAFARSPPPVEAPRLVTSDLAAGVAVLTRLDGEPLSRGRFVSQPLPTSTLAALLDRVVALSRWRDGCALVTDPPPPEVAAAVRERLLEDPTAPARWCADTLARAASAGAVPEGLAAWATSELPAAVDFAHGDLLPRNVLARGGDVALVDWECAGAFTRGWDLAQLWAALPAAQRGSVMEVAGALGLSSRAFAAVSLVALARERFYRARFAVPGDARQAALDEALACIEGVARGA